MDERLLTDDERPADDPLVKEEAHRENRLRGLAQAHFIRQERAVAGHQECDPLELIREGLEGHPKFSAVEEAVERRLEQAEEAVLEEDGVGRRLRTDARLRERRAVRRNRPLPLVSSRAGVHESRRREVRGRGRELPSLAGDAQPQPPERPPPGRVGEQARFATPGPFSPFPKGRGNGPPLGGVGRGLVSRTAGDSHLAASEIASRMRANGSVSRRRIDAVEDAATTSRSVRKSGQEQALRCGGRAAQRQLAVPHRHDRHLDPRSQRQNAGRVTHDQVRAWCSSSDERLADRS